jgi:hypothetical protein
MSVRAPLAPLQANTMGMPGQVPMVAKQFATIRSSSPIPGSKSFEPGLYAIIPPAAAPQRSPSPVLRTVSLLSPHTSVRNPSPTPGRTLLLLQPAPMSPRPGALSPRPASPVLVFRLQQQPQQDQQSERLPQQIMCTASNHGQTHVLSQLYSST